MRDQNKNILTFGIKLIFGIMGLLVAAIFAVAAGYLLYYFKVQLQGHPIPFILAIVAVTAWWAIMIILDTSRKVKAIFAREHVNLRWFIIMPLALAFGIIMMVVYLMPSSINFSDIINSDFNNTPTIDFAVYFVAYVLLQVSSLFVYFSIKNLRLSQHLHKVKFPVYSIVNAGMFALMIFVVFTLILPNINALPQNVADSYTHNDGPWVTWNSDPTTSACISWLTSSRSDTTLNLGTSPSTITTIKTGDGNVFLHKVYLTGLIPDTKYYYTIPVNFEEAFTSTTFSFRTAPATPRNFTFAVFGDKQPTTSTTMLYYNNLVASGIAAHAKADFVMQIGDVADNGDNIESWHRTLSSLCLLSANTPTQIAVGNHDYGSTNAANFGQIFSYPYNDSSKGWYYSFNYSNVHFIVIDGSAIGGEYRTNQIAWITDDLKAASTAGYSFIFAFVHQTVISSGSANTIWQLQEDLVPLFDHYGVKAVFYGHDHFYEHYNYTYGNQGLLYSPTDTWTHHPIQYFDTGGGGANLEAWAYGILDRGTSNFTRTWYNSTRGAYQNITYIMNSWNRNNNYTADTDKAPQGIIYYQDPIKGLYQTDSQQYGYQYGENSYHYILVQVNGTTCTISTHYADGSLMTGPNGNFHQMFTIT
ncbi:MAG TPA: metallophosphoesterase [Candidatus Lokiarchaeia archaeon]|nr:metallophosphoesterase [Candidatus Lokiarchaeia archaeon]